LKSNIKKNVTYLSYTGMNESLAESQVIPYINLISKFSEVHLISYEKVVLTNIEKKNISSKFKSHKIKWSSKKYHKSPRMLATIYDVFSMIFLLILDRQKNNMHYIHCRSYVTCFAAFCYSFLFSRVRYIFDMRAFWPDEMVSGKTLKKTSFVYSILKKIEKILISYSYSTIVLTDAARKYLLSKSEFNHKKIFTIPTCVDHVKFDERNLKSDLIISNNIVIGTFGTINSGWFMMKEFANFLSLFKTINPKTIFRIVTQDNPEQLLSQFSSFGINKDDVEIYSASSNKMPEEIVKFDIVIMFFVSNFSKLGSAPTRFGEALASGIPCVVNSGVGDLDKIVYENNVGVITHEFTDLVMKKNCNEIISLLKDKSVSKRCRDVSKKYFSFEVANNYYKDLYG
jgi:glycosyltransferase involved in cell wall biosynthesis